MGLSAVLHICHSWKCCVKNTQWIMWKIHIELLSRSSFRLDLNRTIEHMLQMLLTSSESVEKVEAKGASTICLQHCG